MQSTKPLTANYFFVNKLIMRPTLLKKLNGDRKPVHLITGPFREERLKTWRLLQFMKTYFVSYFLLKICILEIQKMEVKSMYIYRFLKSLKY